MRLSRLANAQNPLHSQAQCKPINARGARRGAPAFRLRHICNAANPFDKPAVTVASKERPASTFDADLPYVNKTWTWKGYKINYAIAGCGKPVLLVHGFGASVGHWRKNIPELAKTHKVYAIDLLGFGASAKPSELSFSMEVWRDLVLDFLAEFVQEPVVLVGNSIGSLACLMVAADGGPSAVRGTVLLNSAGAMNNKGVVNDWRIVLAYPIFLLIDFLLKTRPIAQVLFDNFRTADNIRNVLSKVYRNQDAVTDELVDIIYKPSNDPGALDVFVSVITGPPGPRPQDLVPKISTPLLVLWGDVDPFTPADGPIGRFFQELPQTSSNVVFKFLKDVGHCPHDDRPELVHAELLPWLYALDGMATCGEAPARANAAAAADVTA